MIKTVLTNQSNAIDSRMYLGEYLNENASQYMESGVLHDRRNPHYC